MNSTLITWLVVAVTIAGLGVALRTCSLRIAAAQETIARLTEERASAIKANEAQSELIAANDAAIAHAKEAAAKAESDSTAALADVKHFKALVASNQQELDLLRQIDLMNKDCQAFIDHDLAKTCPNLAEAIKEHAK